MPKPPSHSRSLGNTLLIEDVLAALPGQSSSNKGTASPQLFFEIVQQSPLAISITDDTANILYVNPAFEALTGYDRASILGENESVLSHKQTPADVYSDLWTTIQSKHAWRGTLVNRRRNGAAYLAELSISPVLNDQGAICYFLGIHRDVTELHALEQKVLHQKGLIESVLDSAPVVVALIDVEGKVVLDNQAYKKLLGDLRGREPATLFAEVLRQDGLDLTRACRQGQGFDDLEVRLDIAGRVEPRWFSVSATAVDELDDTAGSYFGQSLPRRRCLLLVASEITALKRQMEQVRIQHLRASLAEQQRIQGMREALSGAVFQLQTPVNVIQAAVAMLDRGTDLSKTREALDEVLVSAQKAMETLRGALPAELQESETSVNLNAVLQDVLTLMTEAFLAQGVLIEWHPQAVLRTIIGRPNQLRNLFMRLFENALQAVAESGKDHRVIRITTRSQDDRVEAIVQDNGSGIAEALRLKVFEPFYTGWRHARGHAGMGLSLVQETVNQHGGVIDVNPAFRDGCQIRITFPVSDRKFEL